MPRQTVTVTVVDATEYDPDFPFRFDSEGRTLVGAIAALQELLEEVPPEHRDNAQFVVESEEEYGWHKARVRVDYTRPETDEEMTRREGLEALRLRNAEDRERAELARLLAKHGSPA